MIPVLEHKLCDWASRALGALFPPPSYDDFSETELRDLYSRNDWIDDRCSLACIAGLLVGLALAYIKPAVTGWDLLVAFGLATALPMLLVVMTTWQLGRGRLPEFLQYYSLKHGYHWLGVTCVMYLPLLVAGAVGGYMGYLR